MIITGSLIVLAEVTSACASTSARTGCTRLWNIASRGIGSVSRTAEIWSASLRSAAVTGAADGVATARAGRGGVGAPLVGLGGLAVFAGLGAATAVVVAVVADGEGTAVGAAVTGERATADGLGPAAATRGDEPGTGAGRFCAETVARTAVCTAWSKSGAGPHALVTPSSEHSAMALIARLTLPQLEQPLSVCHDLPSSGNDVRYL